MQSDSASQLVQSPRMPYGDYIDDELVQLSNGDVTAVGYRSFNVITGGTVAGFLAWLIGTGGAVR